MGSKSGKKTWEVKWAGCTGLAHLEMKNLFCSGGKAAYGNISYWDRMILYCIMNMCKIQFPSLSSILLQCVQRRYRTSSIDGRWHSDTVLVCKVAAPSSIPGPHQESLNLLGGLRWQGTWACGLVSAGRKRLKNTYNSQTAHTHTHTHPYILYMYTYIY